MEEKQQQNKAMKNTHVSVFYLPVPLLMIKLHLGQNAVYQQHITWIRKEIMIAKIHVQQLLVFVENAIMKDLLFCSSPTWWR